MKVRIIKTSNPGYWYSGIIGKVFEVYNNTDEKYYYETKIHNEIIRKEDCEIVVDEEIEDLQQKLDKVKEHLGKDEFNKIFEEKIVFDKEKVYLCIMSSGRYKLHRVESRYAWIHLESSNCYASGTFGSGQDAINMSVGRLNYEAQVFDSMKDAIEKGFFND